jgi:hypothetical protein
VDQKSTSFQLDVEIRNGKVGIHVVGNAGQFVLVFICGHSLGNFVLASVVELESPSISRIPPPLSMRKLFLRGIKF